MTNGNHSRGGGHIAKFFFFSFFFYHKRKKNSSLMLAFSKAAAGWSCDDACEEVKTPQKPQKNTKPTKTHPKAVGKQGNFVLSRTRRRGRMAWKRIRKSRNAQLQREFGDWWFSLSLSLLKEGARVPKETEVGHLVTRVDIRMVATMKIYILILRGSSSASMYLRWENILCIKLGNFSPKSTWGQKKGVGSIIEPRVTHGLGYSSLEFLG